MPLPIPEVGGSGWRSGPISARAKHSSTRTMQLSPRYWRIPFLQNCLPPSTCLCPRTSTRGASPARERRVETEAAIGTFPAEAEWAGSASAFSPRTVNPCPFCGLLTATPFTLMGLFLVPVLFKMMPAPPAEC